MFKWLEDLFNNEVSYIYNELTNENVYIGKSHKDSSYTIIGKFNDNWSHKRLELYKQIDNEFVTCMERIYKVSGIYKCVVTYYLAEIKFKKFNNKKEFEEFYWPTPKTIYLNIEV
jgi:hypothetical protein